MTCEIVPGATCAWYCRTHDCLMDERPRPIRCKEVRVTFDVQIGDTLYPLVRDVTHQHPSAVHEHLGTDTTTIDPEVTLQRLLDALAADDWFTDDGRYLGRDMFGIGIQGHP